MIDKDRVHEVPSILLKIVHERVDQLSDEDKDKYRKEVNRFVRQYGFLAQLMDFTDPELEKFYVFSKVFYKYLPYTKETLPMELMGMIDLDKLRIQLSFDGAIELEDSPTELKATRIGEVGKKVEDEKKTVAELLDMVNSPFAAILNENDKIIKQIWDELLSDPEVVDAARAGNSYDVMVNICKEKFGDAIIDQIDKYYHFKEILDKEKGFALTLVGKFVEAVAKQAAATSSFVYDEAVLKEKLIEAMQGEMAGVCSKMRSLPEIIDNLFFVLNTVSIPKLDGIDLLLKEALNNIYANPNITPIVRYTFFNSLVQKYEAFLKKLYFLIKDDEIQGQDGKEPGLADAIHAFKCLWNLKYSTDDDGKKFSAYLQMVRNWRNDEAHNAPCSTDEEVNAGIKVVVALYLYVIAYSITDLEMAGRDVEGTADVVPYKLPEDKGASYAFAAEEKHRDKKKY